MLTLQEKEFLEAALAGNTSKLEAMLQLSPQLIIIKNNHGATAMHLAARNGHNNTIEFLEKKGLKLDDKTNDGLTAMHSAAQGGQNVTIEFLEKKGLKLDDKTNDGSTAMHYAARNGHNNTIEFLEKKGLKLGEKNNHGLTAMHYAARNGHNNTIEFLVSKGLNIEERDNKGNTPLSLAIQLKQVHTVQFLQAKIAARQLSTSAISSTSNINNLHSGNHTTIQPNLSSSNNNNAPANLIKQIQDLTNDNEKLKKSNRNNEALLIEKDLEILQLKSKLEFAEQLLNRYMGNTLAFTQTPIHEKNTTTITTTSALPNQFREVNNNANQPLSNIKSETSNLTFQEREHRKRSANSSEIGSNKNSRTG
ncbi:Ankyrin repeat protein [Rickettsiales bacterium Ac37b]|nr:Ankyrin repeat protein [Rickettsiales bacterium Ac37b]